MPAAKLDLNDTELGLAAALYAVGMMVLAFVAAELAKYMNSYRIIGELRPSAVVWLQFRSRRQEQRHVLLRTLAACVQEGPPPPPP